MTAPLVTFRQVDEDDRERLLAWRNSPDVAPYMYSDHVITALEHGRWFAGIGADPSRAYWIIEMDGTPVGLVNLYDIDRAAGTCAWAYYLADPATRGRGVGAFVELAMLDYVLVREGFSALVCEVLEANEAVWKLHQSFGFEVVKQLAGRAVKGGATLDALRLNLTAARWTEVRGPCVARLADRGFDVTAPVSL